MTSRTISEAAQSARVGRAILHRWLRNDENFRRCLQAARRHALGLVTARLQQMAVKSVESLEAIITDETASSGAVSAASAPT